MNTTKGHEVRISDNESAIDRLIERQDETRALVYETREMLRERWDAVQRKAAWFLGIHIAALLSIIGLLIGIVLS